MMSRVARRLALSLSMSVLILTGCVTPSTEPLPDRQVPTPEAPVTQKTEPPEPAITKSSPPGLRDRVKELIERDPLFAVMAAELQAQRGQLDDASLIYTEAARLYGDAELAKRSIELTLAAGNPELALRSAEAWAEIEPEDAQAARSVMLLQLSTNRVTEAMPAVREYLNKVQGNAGDHAGLDVANPAKVVFDLMSRVPDAGKAYSAALEVLGNDPLQSDVQYVLSQLASTAGKPDQAIEHLQHVLTQVPEERYNVLMAQYMEKKDGNPTAAIEFLSARADRNPNWATARFYLARIYTEQGDWANARDRFKELIRLQPENYALYSSQGFVLSQMGELKEAERHFNIYLNKVPPSERQNEFLIYLSMADLHAKGADYENAMQWLKKYPEFADNLDIQLKVHDLYQQQNRTSEALAVLEKFQPRTEEDAVRLALVHSQYSEKIKQPAKAETVIEQALTAYPDQPDLLYERAMVAERQNDLGKVEKYLRRLIEVNPDNPHGYNALGYTWADNNINLQDALDLIVKANQLAPQDPYIMDSLGWVYFKMGRYQEAEEMLLKAFTLRQDEEIGLHLMELYLTQNRTQDAKGIYETLKAKYPDSAGIKSLLQKSGLVNL